MLTMFMLSVAAVSCSSIFIVLLDPKAGVFMQNECAMESSRMARDSLAVIKCFLMLFRVLCSPFEIWACISYNSIMKIKSNL